eukprot:TRINITY_DN8920_c0_g1_i1.p1 TRINITY_DN8920_c0_g1~~TRINITY_DN8920_c0_g1_i1.p1  ORF type:complete len:309 (-),score=78.04 TRINITY_DN8920_c0_g1_i1:238-1047(-)
MALEKFPDLGQKPVSLVIKLGTKTNQATDDFLSNNLRELYRKNEFTDVVLVCADRSFPAHRAVIGARSEVLKQMLLASGGATAVGSDGVRRQEIRLNEFVSNPEAVKFMLDFLYQMSGDVWADYNPQTQEINKDVLRLAQKFGLPALTERATHWLAKDLTTGNVVERLTICEDFELNELKEKVLEQLTYNKRALAEVANSPQIMAYPKLMQAMLRLAAAAPPPPKQPSPQKPKSEPKSAEKEKPAPPAAKPTKSKASAPEPQPKKKSKK